MTFGHNQHTDRRRFVPTDNQARESLARHLARSDREREDYIRRCPLMEVALRGFSALRETLKGQA